VFQVGQYLSLTNFELIGALQGATIELRQGVLNVSPDGSLAFS
jgi:hypothetical protein